MNAEYKHIKIAFLTSDDPKDRRVWSGTYYFMAKALEKHCGEVRYLGPVKPPFRIFGKVSNKLSQLLLQKRYDYMHSVFLAKSYAKIFGTKLSAGSFDLIFAPAASTEIAFLDTRIPIVYLSDTTFALMHGYYPQFSNLWHLSIKNGNDIEKRAIKKASLILYPSSWAAESAVKDYQADEQRIHVIPFGANLEEIPPKELILHKKKSDCLGLLFLGVHWERKGGGLAFETLLKLEDLGVRTELIVCGCIPPPQFSHPRMTVIPYLNKNDPSQFKKLADLFLMSDILLLPTRSECYGIVFCEANAFGLPVITTATGGVSGAVRNGENGFLLPFSATGFDYAKIIAGIYQDDQRYYDLVRSSRRAFEERLNWDTWAISVKRLILGII
jgi:glycosyltransferase involved in cell wall biosynthesis